MRCPIETPDSALLVEYAAGKLPADAAAALTRHVAECPACAAVVRAQASVWEALDGWQAAPVAAAAFDRRLYQRIQQEVSWWDRLIRPLRPLFGRQGLPAAAAASLLILAGVLLQQRAVLPTPPPAAAQVEIVAPDQAERALEEMELVRAFDSLVHPEAAEPPKL